MNDLRTRAYLVDFNRAGAIGTIVPRAEIAEAAAGTEFPATLVLDLARVEAESGGEGTTHATVAVEWDQPTLEQLLAATEDQEIELRFDERELVMAFDDVEGHGIRERAALLAVAVAAAGVSSSPALARVAADTGGGAGATASSVAVNSQTGVPAVPVGGAERALAQEEKLTQGLQTGQSAVTSTSRESTPSTSGPVIASQGAERALQQDEKLSASTSQGSGSAASSSGDTSLSTGELAGAIAGGALLIAAAGFGATRRRTPPALPA